MSEPLWEERHEPVLVEPILRLVGDVRPRLVFDGTVGLGGHALRILETFDDVGLYVGVDVDPRALDAARRRLAGYGSRVVLCHGSYAEADEILGDERPDFALLDLGLSTLQLSDRSRGFSFRVDAPLDMRMDPTRGRPVSEWLARARPGEIQEVLSRWGEVRGARSLARAIHARRGELRSTADLLAVVESVLPERILRDGKRNPTNQIFQALRIHVNRELEIVEEGLAAVFDRLAPGGVLAVISFHSIEDRLVKAFFRAREGRCTCPPGLPLCGCGARRELEHVTGKPIRPDEEEMERNPASRPAKLRAVRKVEAC